MSIFRTDFNKLASKDNTEATFDVSIETPHEIKVLESDGYELSNEAEMAKIVQESLPPLISIGNEWFKFVLLIEPGADNPHRGSTRCIFDAAVALDITAA